jgi:hypothetical protein
MPARKTAPATQQDLRSLEQRLLKASAGQKDEILRHFDVVVETIRHDLLGINADEIELLKDRVIRIETRVGLTPA